MFVTQRLKWKLRKYLQLHRLGVPAMNYASSRWGDGAKKAAWRATAHMRNSHGVAVGATTQPTKALQAIFGLISEPRILKPSYVWNGYPVRRYGDPRGVVWHHEDANDHNPNDGIQDVMGVHNYHKSLGWRGIGYHFFVALNGDIYEGRPMDTIGGHTLNAGDWIGVCAEGDYEVPAVMPQAQLAALKQLHSFIHRRYPNIPDRKHKDMPGNSTACPGKYYPYEQVVS